VTLKVHSLVQDSYDFDRHSRGDPVHQEVTSAPTMPRDVERAKTRHDFPSGFGARNVGTVGKLANRLNQRVPIDTRLPRAKVLSGPFDDIRKVKFCSSAEADAPSSLGHGGSSRLPWK
jgi:hypothetical protein